MATAAAFAPDGFFRIGDLGYTEADGSFVYLARLSDALRLGGFLANPAEPDAWRNSKRRILSTRSMPFR